MKIVINVIVLYVFFAVNAIAMTEKEFFKDEQSINKAIGYAILTEKLDGARGCINESLEFLDEANKSNEKIKKETIGITGYILWTKATHTILEINNDTMMKQYQEGPYTDLYGYLELLNLSEEQDALIVKKLFSKFKERNISNR